MGLIAIEGIEFYAYHGFHAEEQKIGGRYQLDVYVEVNTRRVASSDELGDTVNYETIYRIAKVEMNKSSKLIETVAQRIVNRIKSIFDKVEHLTVRLSKLDPPIGGKVSRTYVELEEDYVVDCGKCKRSFLSHSLGDCWTKYGKIYPETQSTLMRSFGKNVCKRCLEPYFIKVPEDA